MTLQINAQNYLINFEGTGESKTVSVVVVDNLTVGTNLTLNGSDILCLTFLSNIDPVWDIQSRLRIYPNPMVDNSTLEFLPPVAGDVMISICDITGKPIAQIHSYLENFRQSFRLSGLKNGFYLINIVGQRYRFSGKLISHGQSNGTIRIEKVISNTPAADVMHVKRDVKGVQNTIDMDYSPGEVLRFTGLAGEYSTVVEDVPISNKTITFNFTGVPTLTTSATIATSPSTATSGGLVTADGSLQVTGRGVCWSTAPSPTINDNLTSDGTGTGTFTSIITGLQPVTTYHVRAYATNSVGTAYGNERSFTTNPVVIATLTTTAVTSITPSTAVSGGNITDDGDGTITARGICWATTATPTISDNLTSNGTGERKFYR